MWVRAQPLWPAPGPRLSPTDAPTPQGREQAHTASCQRLLYSTQSGLHPDQLGPSAPRHQDWGTAWHLGSQTSVGPGKVLGTEKTQVLSLLRTSCPSQRLQGFERGLETRQENACRQVPGPATRGLGRPSTEELCGLKQGPQWKPLASGAPRKELFRRAVGPCPGSCRAAFPASRGAGSRSSRLPSSLRLLWQRPCPSGVASGLYSQDSHPWWCPQPSSQAYQGLPGTLGLLQCASRLPGPRALGGACRLPAGLLQPPWVSCFVFFLHITPGKISHLKWMKVTHRSKFQPSIKKTCRDSGS